MHSAAMIPRATVSEITARLDAELARAPEDSILASDADGTIWDGDVGIELFEALLATRGVRDAAREALAAEARAIGASPEGDANAIAATLYAAYGHDRYAHDRAYAMMAWAFGGWHEDELADFCRSVLADRRIEARIRPELVAIFRWADAHRVPVWLVSASPRAVVAVAAPRLGVDAAHVVAMTPAVGPDRRLLPRLQGPLVYGEGKVDALEAARPGARLALLGAFGDSAYDAPLLRAARVPVAVTPGPALVALAPTVSGMLLLDR
jgi:phosphoserine phosphatase